MTSLNERVPPQPRNCNLAVKLSPTASVFSVGDTRILRSASHPVVMSPQPAALPATERAATSKNAYRIRGLIAELHLIFIANLRFVFSYERME